MKMAVAAVYMRVTTDVTVQLASVDFSATKVY